VRVLQQHHTAHSAVAAPARSTQLTPPFLTAGRS
jgi:hypothetical protein